jgi:hypothetical protein
MQSWRVSNPRTNLTRSFLVLIWTFLTSNVHSIKPTFFILTGKRFLIAESRFKVHSVKLRIFLFLRLQSLKVRTAIE